MKPPLFLLTACTLALFFSGCLSIPNFRISQNQAAFDSFAPEIQQKIRAGDVDIGFTAEQVQMALGKPARYLKHKNIDGTNDVWVYNRVCTRHTIHEGKRIPLTETIETARIRFKDGAVASIEE